MSIRIDPASGLKIFNTRAAKATDKIAGKGYSVVTDEALTYERELPKDLRKVWRRAQKLASEA